MKQKSLLKTMLLLFALIAGSSSVWGADEEVATATFNGKNATYTEGWSTTGTGKTRTDCIVIGFDENITSPAFDLSEYSSVTISIKARRFGTITGSKATIDVSIGGNSVGTTDATGTSATTSLTNITFTPTSSMTAAELVFTCTNATSAGSTHGAGINTITITGTKTSVLSSIAVSGTYPTTFHQGDAFSHEGAVVTATYADASTADVTSSASFSTPDMSTTGTKTVTVSYTENEVTKTTTYDITVNAPATLTGIALSGTYETSFEQNSAFSYDGLIVTASYDDATSKAVTGYTVSSPDMTTLGTKTVTISYTENEVTKTATYDITVTEVIDYVTLPFNWAGGASATLKALTGVTAYCDGSDYSSGNTPYIVKFSKDGHYILVKTDSQPGQISVGIKMLGGADATSITIQGSANGTDFTNVETLTISGAKNDVLTLKTTKALATTDRYVRLYFNKGSGSNVGVGPISIAAYADIPVTISSATWASFSSDMALDFTGTGVTAYIAKAKDANNVTLTEITKVPANTGIVVNGTAATHDIPVLSGEADATTDNLLQPWLTAGTPSDAEYYTLAVDGSNNPKFKKSSGGTLAAGKAYLVVAGALAPELSVDFGGTTGIKSVDSGQVTVDSYYNLAGQRVANPTKGLYIVNGRKVVIK